MKKIVRFLIVLSILSLMLIGCAEKDKSKNEGNTTENTNENSSASNEGTSNDSSESVTDGSDNQATGTGLQFEQPKKGDTIAEMVIKDYGSIYIRFFPDQAPKAVENFITHAKKGYYDGLIFHRVINEFMIQGGDPTGTGMGGESIWGDTFKDEFSDDLSPYRGALCMANSGPDTNGSQFFIVQAPKVTQDIIDYSKQQGASFTDDQLQNYFKVGGTPWLYKHHTVFGQMYEGFDVLDKIAAAQTDENDKPTTDIVIEKINIKKFE